MASLGVSSSSRRSGRSGGGGGGPPGGRPPHLSSSAALGTSLEKTKLSNDTHTSNHTSGSVKQLRVELKGSEISTTTSTTNNSTSGKSQYCRGNECNCFVAYLILGMVGFVLFWGILMLRIYLPEKYWQWSYIWATPGPSRPKQG